MSARRLALVCSLAGGCTPMQAVSPDMPETAPGHGEGVPEDRREPVRLQLAAVFDGMLTVAALADRGIAVYGPGVLALAPAGEPLRAEPEWLRGWPRDWVVAVGGRWPDRAFVTATAGATRTGMAYSLRRWRDGEWVESPIAGATPQVDYYADYAVAADGAILGLRGHVDFNLGGFDLGPQRVTIDRLDGSPPPWPPPPGQWAVQLLTFADGTLVVVVLEVEHQLYRWSPGARKWAKLPLPIDRNPAVEGRAPPVVVGRDPERLYVHRCAPEGRLGLERLTEGKWRPVAQPPGGCVSSLAEAPGGTLWLVNERGLWRRPPEPEPGRWEAVPLDPVDVSAMSVVALPGAPELPSPRPEPLSPRQVVALEHGEVWVVAAIGDASKEPTRQAVLTTRAVNVPLELEPLYERTGRGSGG